MTPRVFIIDYGMATEHSDSNGEHLPKEKMQFFRGNLYFASISRLEFNRPCRKDDLVSLCYFILFLINDCELPFFKENYDKNETKGSENDLNQMRSFKKKYSLLEMVDQINIPRH